jgi:hypothetical protein
MLTIEDLMVGDIVWHRKRWNYAKVTGIYPTGRVSLMDYSGIFAGKFQMASIHDIDVCELQADTIKASGWKKISEDKWESPDGAIVLEEQHRGFDVYVRGFLLTTEYFIHEFQHLRRFFIDMEFPEVDIDEVHKK